jgi:hypothetical protein
MSSAGQENGGSHGVSLAGQQVLGEYLPGVCMCVSVRVPRECVCACVGIRACVSGNSV